MWWLHIVFAHARVLCLHGGGESNVSFAFRLRDTPLSSTYHLVYANAPRNGDWTGNLSDSLLHLHSLGNFTGIVSFSQGSVMAAAYLADSRTAPVKWLMAFAPYVPTDKELTLTQRSSLVHAANKVQHVYVYTGGRDCISTPMNSLSYASMYFSDRAFADVVPTGAHEVSLASVRNAMRYVNASATVWSEASSCPASSMIALIVALLVLGLVTCVLLCVSGDDTSVWMALTWRLVAFLVTYATSEIVLSYDLTNASVIIAAYASAIKIFLFVIHERLYRSSTEPTPELKLLKDRRKEVGLLYALYFCAIIVAWVYDVEILRWTVVTCLGLHFLGIFIALATPNLGPKYIWPNINNGPPSAAFKVVDVLQLVMIFWCIFGNNTAVQLSASVTIVGVILCFCKVYYITRMDKQLGEYS